MGLGRRSVLAAGVLSMTAPASAQPVKITLGTATPGGGFPVYGDAFIAALKMDSR